MQNIFFKMTFLFLVLLSKVDVAFCSEGNFDQQNTTDRLNGKENKFYRQSLRHMRNNDLEVLTDSILGNLARDGRYLGEVVNNVVVPGVQQSYTKAKDALENLIKKEQEYVPGFKHVLNLAKEDLQNVGSAIRGSMEKKAKALNASIKNLFNEQEGINIQSKIETDTVISSDQSKNETEYPDILKKMEARCENEEPKDKNAPMVFPLERYESPSCPPAYIAGILINKLCIGLVCVALPILIYRYKDRLKANFKNILHKIKEKIYFHNAKQKLGVKNDEK